LWFTLWTSIAQANDDGDDDDIVDLESQILLDNERSHRSRNMASLGSQMTQPVEPIIRRNSYPETKPNICLAFLSCCDRTDLLNHTLAGTIRHLEEDEPDFLTYEIAWVDNGSDPRKTADIANSYQIEHALRLPQNMGLAYGMNLLINNLCTAPYILLLEEDWLYLDDLVALQTPHRKRAIATSMALIENLQTNNLTAFDGRTVMGVFLRHETYDRFLPFPHADVWERRENVNLQKELITPLESKREEQCDEDDSTTTVIADIDYRIYCADSAMQRDFVWGSYTNGAGLYKREHLKKIGRMYGEPGDAFHDRFTEGNYAYRAGLTNCHAALRLTDDTTCTSIWNAECTGAFHHIGGGRGTRPMNAKGTKCADPAWNFFGTPLYAKWHKYQAQIKEPTEPCSREELKELRDVKFRDSGTYYLHSIVGPFFDRKGLGYRCLLSSPNNVPLPFRFRGVQARHTTQEQGGV
jgi:hypothetical protein